MSDFFLLILANEKEKEVFTSQNVKILDSDISDDDDRVWSDPETEILQKDVQDSQLISSPQIPANISTKVGEDSKPGHLENSAPTPTIISNESGKKKKLTKKRPKNTNLDEDVETDGRVPLDDMTNKRRRKAPGWLMKDNILY